MYDAPPEMMIDPDAYYYATLRTEKGDIKVQLFADRAPNTVNNFVFLAREGFYDNTTFHRVIDGFMAQAGDPAATGAGGPGYLFEDEFFPGLEFDQSGLLAMANRGPGTNGSQFFITFSPTEWLNGGHTIFGKVIEGEDVLADITRIDPQIDAGLHRRPGLRHRHRRIRRQHPAHTDALAAHAHAHCHAHALCTQCAGRG